VLADLARLTSSLPYPEICDHLHVFSGEDVLLEGHDAFAHTFFVSGLVQESRLKDLCAAIGCDYRTVGEKDGFGSGRKRGPVLHCSFCNKSQDDVRRLVAGPGVFICNECVQVCVDIIAEDRRNTGAVEDYGAVVSPEAPRWSATARCMMCHMPVVLEELLTVESRGVLCRPCVSAVQAAAAQDEEIK
jgi:hypothetical protein